MSKSRGLRRRHRNRAKLKLARKFARWNELLVQPIMRRVDYARTGRGCITVFSLEGAPPESAP